MSAVRRAYGEPTVLDEDLALAWLTGAGVAPEACLGVLAIRDGAGAEMRDLGGWIPEPSAWHGHRCFGVPYDADRSARPGRRAT